jgi:hypothetical protein
MRLSSALLLAAFLSLLGLALGGDRPAAGAQIIRPSPLSQPQLVHKAMFVCGTFDGKFQCKNSPGGVARGKNATPGAAEPDSSEGLSGEQQATSPPISPAPGDANAPQGTWAATPDAATTCQHGMVGTPPDCRCPKNSELLGGNCVHYTASACSNGLASDAMPQACQGVEEKLSCTMRQDGLKDCCCLTYDKF